jgi:outer membrane biosynthesis protein TonB
MIQSSNPVLLNISFVVVALHLILFGWMAFSSEHYPIQKTSRPLVVKTVTLRPAAPIQAPKKEAPLKKNESVKKEQLKKSESAKKEQPKLKSEVKAKSEPKPKAVAKKSPKVENKPKPINPKMQSLLAQAQATMEKVQKTPGKASAISLPVPQLLHSEEKLTTKETGYQEELASLLKLLLRLPEYGQVSLELTLDRSGKVKKIKFLQSENNRNRSYIEKAIWTVAFPAFGNNFSSASEYTFHIQLENEL